MYKLPDIQELTDGILAGNIALLSRAITLVESNKKEHRNLASSLIDNILPYSGKSVRIGITGVPGVGKSSFIESFGMYLAAQGKKIAALAIDPSSSLSKGSILGDKTRMQHLSVHPNVYIRPSPSGGSLGGLTNKTGETVLLCEAAGFDTIFVETVGVGQSETEVSRITDFFLLLMLAGAGDELQGIKRGIMEMADGLVITKADGQNINKAKTARTEYARAMHFLPPQPSGWIPQVKICSSLENTGIDEIWQMIEQYIQHQQSNNYFYTKRKEQNQIAYYRLLEASLIELLYDNDSLKSIMQSVELQVKDGTISPYSAVKKIMETFSGK